MIVFGLSGVLGGGSCDSSTGAPRSVASSKTSAPAPASARCLVAEPREASAASRPSEADGCPADPVFGGRELSRGTVRFPDAPGAPSLDVELAVTPRDRQRGLMYRTRLGENRGMLFDFGLPERRQSFWMRNTCISLDMLFVNEDGHIAGIIENVPPMNDASRSIPCPVRYVLEVDAGWSRAHRVRPGQRLTLP